MYTVGIRYYAGYHMPLFVRSNAPEIMPASEFYTLIFTLESDVKCKINQEIYQYPKSSVIYLNEEDQLQEISGKVQMIFFSPILVNRHFSINALNAKEEKVTEFGEYIYLTNFFRNPNEKVKSMNLSPLSAAKINNLILKMEYQLKEQRDNYWPCRSKAFLDEILFHLIYPEHFDPNEVAEDNENLMENIKSYINSHISEDISTTTLTRTFNINRTTLVEKFHDYFKLSPLKYIINQRIELAKVILANTGVPIVEISSKVGINSPAHFSKIFKDATGLSPSGYRAIKSKAI